MSAPDKISSVRVPHHETTCSSLRAALLALPFVLVQAACTAQPAAPAPVATVTVTAMVSPSPTPSQEPVDEDDWQQPERPFEPWQEAVWIFGKSQDSGRPVKQRYLAAIRKATYHESSGALTVTLDKVTWNPKYRDGNNEDPILNPLVKWETVDLGDVAVLVDAANGFQHLNRTDFPAFVRDDDRRARSDDGAGWRTPFNFWFIGNEPVALVERYVP